MEDPKNTKELFFWFVFFYKAQNRVGRKLLGLDCDSFGDGTLRKVEEIIGKETNSTVVLTGWQVLMGGKKTTEDECCQN